MKPQITEEQRQAIEAHHGFLEVEDAGEKWVLMSMDVFREMLGIDSDSEMEQSLKAIEAGLADVAAGRTRPFREVLDSLGRSE